MFDRTVVFPMRSRTEYVTREVHEHRAPTDQSVALLKEMEDAARNKITESIKVADTHFECVIHMMRDCYSDENVYRAVFSLNGKKLTADHRERVTESIRDRLAWAVGLRDAVAKEIASHILADGFNRMQPLKF